MVQRNPYETNTPVDVPSFMQPTAKRKQQPEEDIDMSYFKLNEEELKKSEEQPVKKKTKKKNRINSLLLVVAGVCGVITIVCIVLSISSSNKYRALNSEYETYKQTTQGQIDRVTSEMKNLQKELEDYKIAHPEVVENTPEEPKSEEPKKEENPSSSTTTSFKTGTYKFASVQIRTGAGKDNPAVKQEDMPDQLKWITFDNGVIVDGSEANVKEVKVVSDGVWGKLADNCWACMKDGNSVFVE